MKPNKPNNARMFEARYGGKTGLVNLLASKASLYAGKFRRWENIDFSIVDNFVFICKGNISRSPYSEARALKLGCRADSYGTEAGNGNAAENNASKNALDRGLDLSSHRSTHLSRFHPESGDLVLCYEPIHANYVEQHVMGNSGGNTVAQISLLGLWSIPQRPIIFDPYGLHDDYYQTCYTLIDSAIENLVAKSRCYESCDRA